MTEVTLRSNTYKLSHDKASCVVITSSLPEPIHPHLYPFLHYAPSLYFLHVYLRWSHVNYVVITSSPPEPIHPHLSPFLRYAPPLFIFQVFLRWSRVRGLL